MTSIASPDVIPVNAWTHLASTYDGANIRLFVNGTQVAGVAATGSIAVNTLPVWIGANNPNGEYFNGVIDEVRIYNRALSVTEIQTDMTTPVEGAAAPSAPLAPTLTVSQFDATNGFTLRIEGPPGQQYPSSPPWISTCGRKSERSSTTKA